MAKTGRGQNRSWPKQVAAKQGRAHFPPLRGSDGSLFNSTIVHLSLLRSRSNSTIHFMLWSCALDHDPLSVPRSPNIRPQTHSLICPEALSHQLIEMVSLTLTETSSRHHQTQCSQSRNSLQPHLAQAISAQKGTEGVGGGIEAGQESGGSSPVGGSDCHDRAVLRTRPRSGWQSPIQNFKLQWQARDCEAEADLARMQEEHSVSSEEPKFEVQQLRARVAQLEEIRGRHVRGSEEAAEHIRTKVAKRRVGGCAEDVLPSTEQDLVCGWTTSRQNSGEHWMWQTSSQASSPGLSWPQVDVENGWSRLGGQMVVSVVCYSRLGLVIQGAVVLRAFCSSCLTCL